MAKRRTIKGRERKSIRLKLIPKAPKVKSMKIPAPMASSQDIIKSVERDDRIKKERGERISKQLKEVKKFTEQTIERAAQIAASKLKRKAVSRRVLKRGQATLVIRQRENEPYKAIFFKR